MADIDIGGPLQRRRVQLFDGASLAGWQPKDDSHSWTVQDGCLRAHGPASTLLAAATQPRQLPHGFILEIEAMTRPGARGSICIGSAAQDSERLRITIASPASATDDPGTWLRTGSIEGRNHIYKNMVPDDTWFQLRITVGANRIQIDLNQLLLVDFVEHHNFVSEDELSIALNWAGGDSEILFRKIELQEPARQSPPATDLPGLDETDKKIRALIAKGIPVLDLHAHLKGGLTLDCVLRRSRHQRIQYGLAVNCGKGFPIETDEQASAFCAEMRQQPVLAGMQAEGREWTSMFSRQTAASFHYIFTDSMTWTDTYGRRMRLWIPEEVGGITNVEDFMETLVARTVGILEHEPIDIYVNPTFLPAVIAEGYNQLWTDERIQRIVEAAARNQVAIELNDLYQLPSAKFIRAAKAAGCRFTLGSNNTSPSDLRRCDYGLQMIEFCGLQARDFSSPIRFTRGPYYGKLTACTASRRVA